MTQIRYNNKSYCVSSSNNAKDIVYNDSTIKDELDKINSNIEEQNKNNVYSTEEINTGKTWIDGKKIYRKCFTGTYSHEDDLYSGISDIISVSGTMTTDSGNIKRVVPYSEYYNGMSFRCTVHLMNNKILIMTSENQTAINLIIEYTKI